MKTYGLLDPKAGQVLNPAVVALKYPGLEKGVVRKAIARPLLRTLGCDINRKEDFEALDRDKDGKMSRPEVVRFAQDVAPLLASEGTYPFFQSWDLDQDGQVSPTEFARGSGVGHAGEAGVLA